MVRRLPERQRRICCCSEKDGKHQKFFYAFIPSLTEGGDKAVRCAYNEEYDCYNEARVDDKDYPAIDGKNYCKIHWKQLNDIKE